MTNESEPTARKHSHAHQHTDSDTNRYVHTHPHKGPDLTALYDADEKHTLVATDHKHEHKEAPDD